MSKSVNDVRLLGRLGKAAEVRTTQGGTTVANFSLATERGVKDARGNWQDVTEWHNLVAFGRIAEIVRDYTSKGSRVYVEGRLQTRSWDDRESGKKQYRTEVVVEDVTLLDGRGKSDGRQPGDESSGHSTPYADQGITDEDIPF